MDQKEIDELLKAGTFKDYNEKQEELIRNISDKSKRTPPPAAAGQDEEEIAPPIPTGEKQGRVMGQLSRVTEESEAGTNVVMEYMENVLNTISMQQGFIKDIRNKFREFPSEINIDEVLTFVNDSLCTIEENIFGAMDAFQFQDIGRQKLMKVMYTLAKLNDYLNELLGTDDDQGKTFGHKIEEKTLEKDKEKDSVDSIVEDFHKEDNGADSATGGGNADIVDVDKIVAEFQKKS